MPDPAPPPPAKPAAPSVPPAPAQAAPQTAPASQAPAPIAPAPQPAATPEAAETKTDTKAPPAAPAETKPAAAEVAPRIPRELERIATELHETQVSLWTAAGNLAAQCRTWSETGKEPESHAESEAFHEALAAALPNLSKRQKEIASIQPIDAAGLERLCRDIQVAIAQKL